MSRGRAARRSRDLLLSVGAVVAFLLLWEVAGRLRLVSPLLLAPPSAVARQFWTLLASGDLARHFLASFKILVAGFGLAVVTGIGAGFLLGASETLAAVSTPFLLGLYSTPRITLMPLIVVWFGLGFLTHTLVVFLSAFFPICINTWIGVRTVDRTLIECARTFGANRWDLFLKVAMPATVPYVMAGLRIGIGVGLIGMFFAEFWGAEAGIGVMTVRASNEYNTPELFVGILVLAGMGIVFGEGVRLLERRVARWRSTEVRF